jgi:hypothetical protein
MDVTGILTLWLSGSLPNNGFIVHHGLQNEADTLDYGVIKFYSKETQTIYQPKLEIVWDDSTFSTGSLSSITGSVSDDVFENTKVVITNLKKEYKIGETHKIRIKGRDKFPKKSFGTTYEYEQTKYLPITAYYQIEDYITEDVIVPFGDYSKISCDSISNYFYLDTNDYAINRSYKIKIKIVIDGESTIINDKYIFEIVE